MGWHHHWAVRKVVGITLIVLGLTFLFLPILPGIPLIIIGLVVIYGKALAKRIVNRWHKRGSKFFGIPHKPLKF